MYTTRQGLRGQVFHFKPKGLIINHQINRSIHHLIKQPVGSWVALCSQLPTSLPGCLTFSGHGTRFSWLCRYCDVFIVLGLHQNQYTTVQGGISETELTVHMQAKPSKDLQLQPRSVKERRHKTGILGTAIDGVAPN